MKVLKFGGSSVGTVAPLLNVRNIVSSRKEDEIVVVSALGGVTDLLLKASQMASDGDMGYATILDDIRLRHMSMIDELFPGGAAVLKDTVGGLLDSLEGILHGVHALRVLPEKSRCEIVSFGERLSSRIVAALLDGADLKDSLQFIKTVEKDGRTVLDQELTESLTKEAFKDFKGLSVVPGFIATDSATGHITTLGRGGSDYTASIIAAALDAESLEIWTDVDGFMTADPRIIKTSYVIDELSFVEAMELCNFGAKVVYAPALYPVYPKDIPVYIKNTFKPEAKGTVIRRNVKPSGRTVTGITSIDNISLLNLSGASLVGIIGVDSRIFSSLSRKGISVFLVSQSSSETGISLGISQKDAEAAKTALDEEFSEEISRGVMNPSTVENELAAVAVVGPDMKRGKGIAGRLFTTLSRNSIGVVACAQGSSEHNISMVISRNYLRKALNVIHDSFFLSEYQELNLFICGVGLVGGSLIEQIRSQRQKLMEKRNLKLNIVGIARSTKGVFDRDGIDLESWKEALAGGRSIDPQTLRDEVIGMNIFNSVFVDCTASADIATIYKDLLENGISVVAANKVAASSEYSNYKALKDAALKHGVKFLFETNVGAGLPIINTINALRGSGDTVQKIEAVVSGTLNFIFNTISEDIPFSRTVKMAQEQGFSEPDPRLDLSGKDVIRKLVILARESGYEVEQSDVQANLFIPADFFECSMEEFWRRLPSLDEDFEKRRRSLVSEHKRWRFVASMEDGRYSVGLREIPQDHSFYELEGSNNIVLITTERYHEHPMLIQGYGAGAAVTAAGVFADIMSIANV